MTSSGTSIGGMLLVACWVLGGGALYFVDNRVALIFVAGLWIGFGVAQLGHVLARRDLVDQVKH